MPKITFHGHSCFVISGNEGSVIIDPFLTGNSMADIKPEDVSVDAILLSHGHGDHLGDTLTIAERTGALVVAPFELASYCQMKGAPKVHGMHIGGSRQFSFGWVKLVPAFHGSACIENDGSIVYTGNPCGYLVKIDGKLIYHAGDTGLFGDMKLWGDLYNIDVSLLPIGDNYVMGPEDAVVAAGFLKSKIVIPMHYDTFELIKQDAEKFKKVVEEKTGSSCIILKPGESLEL
ncbi:MAG TPA: metal-dependent hydrolase [Peptococcaceae bacterium]|nr:MAG: hypothetical protein XD50_1630 [Clostridia bacterium 41_269]HBT19902.1 metal-dependent hydrolase [Peptococcaceae bacterium]